MLSENTIEVVLSLMFNGLGKVKLYTSLQSNTVQINFKLQYKYNKKAYSFIILKKYYLSNQWWFI